jgi:hypothetical protein
MKKKVSQSEIQDYLNVLERNTLPGLSISKAMAAQGFTPFEIGKYLRSNGTDESDIIRILREINR